MKNGKNGTENKPKLIETCLRCGDVVYCPEYSVDTKDGVCEACLERLELIKVLTQEEISYGIHELYSE